MNDEEFLKSIMPDVEKYFLKNNGGYIIEPGYEWVRDVVTLYAKQHNLVEATILLLDSGMNEEAFVLSRSAINNYFLIGYLLNDDANRSRLKEYHIQPLISQRYLLKNMKEMLQGEFGKRMQQHGVNFGFDINDIKNRKYQIEQEISKKGFPVTKKTLSILDLAKKSDKQGFDLYATYYAEASKFEHSDISSLNIYKQPVDDQTSINDAFIMDLNITDTDLKDKIYGILIVSYLDSLVKIIDSIINKEPHLKANYDENKLADIMVRVLTYINK